MIVLRSGLLRRGTAFRDERYPVKRPPARGVSGTDMFGLGRKKAKAAIRRILIVEDEPLIAFDNEHFLGESGFEVVATVDTAAAAGRLIEAGGIDLVTADVRLHEGSGIDVARVAHAKGVPVLFVTGNCPGEAETLAAGCLAKPYTQRELLDAIRAVAAVARGEAPGRLPAGLKLFAR